MSTVVAVSGGDRGSEADAPADGGLLVARTSIPPVPGAVPRRPAVEARLDEAVTRRVTVVSAGPGWGKTTAVAQWAGEQPAGSVRWLTLEPEDDRPSAFWRAFLHALHGAGGLDRLQAPVELSPSFLRQVQLAIAALPVPVTLVLDDFHLISNREVLATFAHLVRHDVPLRVVIVTRSDPRLPLTRLRFDGQVSMVVADDLALDAEAVTALADGEGVPLTPAGVDELLADTEGWAVGVRLRVMAGAAGSRRRLDPTKSIAEYLVAEVLDRNTVAARDFLLRTSVASPVSVSLAEAIVPGADARSLLDGFVAANEFVTLVDPSGSWFRYHPILRQMLSGQLRLDDRSAFRNSHRRAARWLAVNGEPVRALEHALASDDAALFGILFVTSAGALLAGPERAAVVAASARLPYADLEPDAGTELSAATVAIVEGRTAAAASHVERARALAPASPEPQAAHALTEILAAWVARGLGDDAAGLRAARAAASALDAVPWSFPALPTYDQFARHQLAVGLAWTGQLAAARVELHAVLLGAAGPPSLVTLGARSCLAFCEALALRLDESRADADRALAEATDLGWDAQTPLRLAYAATALGAVLRGDEDHADLVIARALAADAGQREPGTTIALKLLEVMSCLGRGRSRGARIAWEAAQDVAAGTGVPRLLDALHLRARTELGLLTPPPAGTPPTFRGDAPVDLQRICLARALLDSGRQAEALGVVRDVAQRAGPGGELDVLTSVEALLTYAASEHSGAAGTDALLAALALAGPLHLVRPFVTVGGGCLADQLERVLAPRHDDFALALRARLGVEHRTEPVPLVERLTERELSMLAALPTMMSNVEIASEAFVSVNTVKAHLKALYRKLGVSSRRDAVRRGRDLGLIP